MDEAAASLSSLIAVCENIKVSCRFALHAGSFPVGCGHMRINSVTRAGKLVDGQAVWKGDDV